MAWGRVLKAFLCLAISVFVIMPSLVKADEKVRKAVYHCDYGDAKRVDAMLQNIYNLVNYYTTKNIPYDVRVVSNAACVQFMLQDRKGTKFESSQIHPELDKSITERMASLVDGYGVKFEQCTITLKRTNIDKARLKPFTTLTDSGQVRVVELQDEGYAYIKVQ